MPLDAPACSVAAHRRPDDVTHFRVWKWDRELLIEGVGPRQQAVIRTSESELAQRREQGRVTPLSRGWEGRETPALWNDGGEIQERIRIASRVGSLIVAVDRVAAQDALLGPEVPKLS